MSPRYSPLRGRKLTRSEAMTERFAMSPLGYRFLLHVAPHIDKVLIARTNGRWSAEGRDRTGLVTTTGAKSGLPRTQPLACIEEPDGSILLVGSNYGRPPHPSWSANLRANPECTLTFKGTTATYKARELDGDERAEVWERIVDWYAGYAQYEKRCAPRKIRVFRLTPA